MMAPQSALQEPCTSKGLGPGMAGCSVTGGQLPAAGCRIAPEQQELQQLHHLPPGRVRQRGRMRKEAVERAGCRGLAQRQRHPRRPSHAQQGLQALRVHRTQHNLPRCLHACWSIACACALLACTHHPTACMQASHEQLHAPCWHASKHLKLCTASMRPHQLPATGCARRHTHARSCHRNQAFFSHGA